MSSKAKVLQAVEFILSLGSDPKDDDRLVMQKRFLLALGSLMSLGGLGWGALCICKLAKEFYLDSTLHLFNNLRLIFGAQARLHFFRL